MWRITSCSMSMPCVSAGWALPEKTKITGRSALPTMRARRSKSAKEQRRPLVRRKPPGKTDDQRRRRKTGRHFLLLFVGNGELLEKFRQRSPEIIQKLLLLELPHRPEALVQGFRLSSPPDGRIRALLLPAPGPSTLSSSARMGAPVYDGTWTPLVTYRMGISRLGHALPAFLPHGGGTCIRRCTLARNE